jgi:hypothetical protein
MTSKRRPKVEFFGNLAAYFMLTCSKKIVRFTLAQKKFNIYAYI